MYKYIILIVSLFFIGCSSSSQPQPKQKIQKITPKKVDNHNIPTQKYEVKKTACMINNNYSILEVKNKLLDKAKKSAVEEIFGTIINSNLELLNGKITKDKIIKKTMGFVRLKGNPKYYNGKNFAEVCVEINAYVTKKDLDIYKLKKVELKHYCYNNPNLSINKIKEAAINNSYIELVKLQKPALKISSNEAKKLLYDIKITNKDFDIDSGVYCFDISAKISFLELEDNYKTSENNSNNSNKVSSNIYLKKGEIQKPQYQTPKQYPNRILKKRILRKIKNFKRLKQKRPMRDIFDELLEEE